jgi:hypothetical protein
VQAVIQHMPSQHRNIRRLGFLLVEVLVVTECWQSIEMETLLAVSLQEIGNTLEDVDG